MHLTFNKYRLPLNSGLEQQQTHYAFSYHNGFHVNTFQMPLYTSEPRTNEYIRLLYCNLAGPTLTMGKQT